MGELTFFIVIILNPRNIALIIKTDHAKSKPKAARYSR